MRRWPWITALLTLVATISPFGQDLIRSSLYSGEQLARHLSQFLLAVFAAIAAALIALEWVIRWFLARRTRMAGHIQGGANDQNTA